MVANHKTVGLFGLAILLLISLPLSAQIEMQSPQLHMSFGFSAWPNNCDVPSGGQDSGIEPSFGPFFSLSYGRLRVGGTFFIGNFDIHPAHGLELDANGEPVFSDPEARERGFTSDGTTRRIDFDFNVGYEFSRYARLSFSLVMNRHEADLLTFWGPVRDAQGEIILPSDPRRLRILDYTDTQLWIGQNFGGSLPVETVSTRFSLFYNTSLLVLASESGDGVFEQPIGTLNETGPRTSYTDEDGNIAFPPRNLGDRSFGDNIGITLSAGAGFQLLNNPPLLIFGGYNVKFFDEQQSSVIDHSVFKGPFAGISITAF